MRVNMKHNLYCYNHPFPLECGEVLPSLTISYHTIGKLNDSASNVIWICHAFTANSNVQDWWKWMLGKNLPFDPQESFIICANIIGSCYGSTGPLSINPATGERYYHSFPLISIRDMVAAHDILRQHLGIQQIKLLVGGSMGGYQALEWAIMQPGIISNLALLATAASESPWGIAIHTAQRMAIEADCSWRTNMHTAGEKGLAAARAIGMITYRSFHSLNKLQEEEHHQKLDQFKAESYIRYQGSKLVSRFNAFSYYALTRSMDTHNIARDRASSLEAVLGTMGMPVLIIGISSDLLCPVSQQEFLAAHISKAKLVIIDSLYGHDGFLVETSLIGSLLQKWLRPKKDFAINKS
jgi:homoserine O-acetyltransferase/O-succinyltransferase